MRAAVLVVLVGVSLVIVAVGRSGWSQLVAQHRPQRSVADSSSDLIAFATDAGTKQQLVVLDSQQRVVCVLHIDRDTGQITLKSVRKITWDLSMEEFNTTSPSPREIRALLER